MNTENAAGKVHTLEGKIVKDLRTLTAFIHIYCRGKKHCGRREVTLKGFDISELCPSKMRLCPDCAKLLHHAIIKRTHCPHDPKPQCKDCTTQCYSKAYKQQIRQVMRFAGWRMLLRGRLDYLWHLVRKPRKPKIQGPQSSQKQESATPSPLVQIHCSKPSPATMDQCGDLHVTAHAPASRRPDLLKVER